MDTEEERIAGELAYQKDINQYQKVLYFGTK